jgi:hypothetical protein
VPHVVADFAFEAQGLFFGCFREFALEWIFLSTVTLLFACVVTFAFCEGSAFARLVEAYTVKLVSFTFGTVSLDFFRNVHGIYQLCIRETYAFLYFMTYKAKSNGF